MKNAVSQESFKEFEHAGWQNVAGKYHDHFASLTSQAIEPLLAAVSESKATVKDAPEESKVSPSDPLLAKDDACPSRHLLDIATGPGYVAHRARQAGFAVSAIDFSPVMVERARSLYQGIRFEEGDAEQLEFGDERFDAVVMNFGLLHLSRPELAIREAHRVLKRDGRFAFTVWAKPDRARAFDIVLRAVDKNGRTDVGLPQGPPFFLFSDHDRAREALLDAGFKEPVIAHIQMTWRLASKDDFFEAFYLGTPRTGGLLRAQAGNDLDAIRKAIYEDLNQFMVDDELRIPMASIVAGARK